MGKRIPKSKKHKKLKFVDPCYKGSGPQSKKKRLQFNQPPVNDDDQEMPKGMVEIIDFKKKLKEKKIKRKKNRYKDDFIIVKNSVVKENEPGMEKAVKKIPKVLKQKRNESANQFVNRLQKMADVAKAEAKVEEKYNIELVHIDKDGNAEYRPENKVTSDRKREKRKRYKEKLQEKKKRKLNDEEFELKKDKVQFGEVVSAPPTFTAKPRKAPVKPEMKFTSKEILESDNSDFLKKTVKLKDLSLDRRKEIEDERSRAVQMYRLMKNKKSL